MSNVISIITECLDLYSIALCHNKIGLIGSITLRNISDFNLKNLELEISSSPEFFTDYSARIGEVASGRYIRLSDIDLSIDTTRLSYLSTPISSSVTILIKSQGEILAEKTEQIQLLPYDTVPCISAYPELVSAFVTPMQSEIRQIGESLHKYVDSSVVPANIDMWKSVDRDTAYEIISAIYYAVRDIRITYNITSVLIDSKHCKIKLPESLLSYKNGNSLEISVLFASVCEYLGFNPLIIFNCGKIFAGVFFTDKTFSSPIVDDGRPFELLSDGVCQDFCIIDPTTLFNGTNISFEDSAKMANKNINYSDFSVVVDIKECRKVGICPIQNRIIKDGNIIFEDLSLNKSDKGFAIPKNLNSFASKIKSLLADDDSLAPLICTPSRTTAFLVGSAKSIAAKFMFNSRVVLKSFFYNGIIPQDSDQMLSTLLKLNKNADVTDVSDSVSTLYEKNEFDKRLVKLIDSEKSKRSLYLAFGLVSGKVSDSKVMSPLFLIPATLTYDNQSFYLSVSKSSTVINSALLDYLNDSIGCTIPFDVKSYDCFESYDLVSKKLQEEVFEAEGLNILDVAFLVKVPYENYLVSSTSTSRYFETSPFIRALIDKKTIKANLPVQVTKDDIQENFFDMPLLLDYSQANAYNSALSNDITVITGPNGSGKTRVASSIAYSSIKEGKSVLYASFSDSNIYKFKSYAKESKMSDFVFSVSKNNLQKNSFENKNSSSAALNESEASCIESIKKSHSYLSNYYTAIHRVREIGFSLYEAISQYERYKTFPYTVNFTNAEVGHLSREDVVHWFDVVSNLAKAGADCHEPFNNPLMYIKCRDFSYDLKSNAVVCLTEYKDLLSDFIDTQSKIADYLGIEVPIIKETQTETLIKLVELIKNNIDYIYPHAYTRSGIESEFVSVESFLNNGRDFFEIKHFLDTNFSSDVLSLDTDALLNEWRNASLRFAITRTGAQNAVKNKLKVFAHDPRIVTSENIVELFSKISNYKNAVSRMTEISVLLRQIFGIDLENEILKDNKLIFEQIRSSLEMTRTYYSVIQDIYDSDKKPEGVFAHNENQFSNKEKFIREISAIFDEYTKLNLSLKETENKLSEMLQLDIEEAKCDNHKIWYYFVEKFIDRMLDNIDLLKHWCSWNKEKEKAVSVGLSGVVNLYTTEQMTYNDIKNAFLKGFFKTVSEYIMSCEPDINNFSKDNFENIQNELIANTEKLRDINSFTFLSEQSAKVKASVEKRCDIGFSDALMLLKRDFEYNDKYYNVSEKSQKILQTIKPCFVSKGTSVLSQLKDCRDFDVLIIDTVEDFKWEEIAVLLPLARKVVLFSENNDEQGISGEFVKLGAPHNSLAWIYSYNFSTSLVNKLFYPDSTSFIFPANNRKGIRVIHQKGTYDRKVTRANFIEASAVVDELMKKLESSPNTSISVISMTEEQSSLIELLFTKRLQALDESQRRAFFDRSEHFLISSLEKASFNPCDTVVFSTTFSIEEKAKYNDTISRTMPEFSSEKSRRNFINALLCAQGEFVLVTSLNEEILKNFKTIIPNYSMFKNIVLHLCDTGDGFFGSEMNKAPRIENSVIRQVINHIEALGYRADIDVGSNSCRIDIAVKNKDGNGYLFGIIFDETAYLYGGDLISRALIVKNLEKNLGWKILRIYMVEWFENSPKQLDLITDLLKDGEKQTPIISFDDF